jgi:SAM-dependent methyltransferase
MEIKRIDYNRLSGFYDQRYRSGEPSGIAEAIGKLVSHPTALRVLEVGCGTGHWLARVTDNHIRFGLDISAGMLEEARQRDRFLNLMRGAACILPFGRQAFDVVFCVHALHHFDDPFAFIKEARRILCTGGRLGIIGMDPQTEEDRWYLYDYFPGTRERDLVRYPSGVVLLEWMHQAGFTKCDRLCVARIIYDYIGYEVFQDPILHKDGTSQLSLLSDEEFSLGISRIQEQLQQGEQNGSEAVFSVDITIPMIIGLASEEHQV